MNSASHVASTVAFFGLSEGTRHLRCRFFIAHPGTLGRAHLISVHAHHRTQVGGSGDGADSVRSPSIDSLLREEGEGEGREEEDLGYCMGERGLVRRELLFLRSLAACPAAPRSRPSPLLPSTFLYRPLCPASCACCFRLCPGTARRTGGASGGMTPITLRGGPRGAHRDPTTTPPPANGRALLPREGIGRTRIGKRVCCIAIAVPLTRPEEETGGEGKGGGGECARGKMSSRGASSHVAPVHWGR